MEAMQNLKEIKSSNSSTINIIAWRKECYEAMNDDFNSPILIAHLFEGVKFVNLLKDNLESLNADDLAIFTKTMHDFVFDVLALEDTKTSNEANTKLEGVVEMLIKCEMKLELIKILQCQIR